jgi:putative Mg2+ transporter-C (MgtC) family protein
VGQEPCAHAALPPMHFRESSIRQTEVNGRAERNCAGAALRPGPQRGRRPSSSRQTGRFGKVQDLNYPLQRLMTFTTVGCGPRSMPHQSEERVAQSNEHDERCTPPQARLWEGKTLHSELDLAGHLVAALVLGGVIGLERELAGEAAGLRTHMMVALGAAVLGLVSVHGFHDFARPRAETNFQVDVSRVASNVVIGIGFLGTGALLKDGTSIRGLTTAASLWVTAAVGLAAGLGAYLVAVTATLAAALCLTFLRGPSVWLRRRFAVLEKPEAVAPDPMKAPRRIASPAVPSPSRSASSHRRMTKKQSSSMPT